MYCVTEKETRSDAVFIARRLYTGSYYATYSSSERMIYLDAVINPGQHYSTSTGEYTCPVTGTYVFTYSIYAYDIKDGSTLSVATASLYMDGTQISRIYLNNENSEDIDISLSRSDIVQCSQGDRVWVQSVYSKNCIWGISVYNMFSEVLLYTT